MDPTLFEIGVDVGLPIILIVVAFFTGTWIERRHFADIRRREQENLGFLTVTFPHVPPGRRVDSVALVTGSVVVSLDHFKRFLAALRNLVGGHVKSYESLLDRARREALLRMQHKAREAGYDAVVNVRLETSRLASSRGRRQTTAGVEVLAFGTALKLAE